METYVSLFIFILADLPYSSSPAVVNCIPFNHSYRSIAFPPFTSEWYASCNLTLTPISFLWSLILSHQWLQLCPLPPERLVLLIKELVALIVGPACLQDHWHKIIAPWFVKAFVCKWTKVPKMMHGSPCQAVAADNDITVLAGIAARPLLNGWTRGDRGADQQRPHCIGQLFNEAVKLSRHNSLADKILCLVCSIHVAPQNLI